MCATRATGANETPGADVATLRALGKEVAVKAEAVARRRAAAANFMVMDERK